MDTADGGESRRYLYVRWRTYRDSRSNSRETADGDGHDAADTRPATDAHARHAAMKIVRIKAVTPGKCRQRKFAGSSGNADKRQDCNDDDDGADDVNDTVHGVAFGVG